MIDATVRLLAGFCAHPQHGVYELASTLPREAFGGNPAPPAPPSFQIYNEVDDEGVARDLTAPSLPALVIWGDSSADINMKGLHKTAKGVAVVFGFFVDPQVDDLVMNRACGYILRGGLLTLARYNDQVKSAGYRTLDGVKVLEIQRVVEQRTAMPIGRQKLLGFLTADVAVVETYL